MGKPDRIAEASVGSATIEFDLPPRAIRIVLLPLAVISASTLMISLLGYPSAPTPELPFATGHLEAAGRLRLLASWLLLTAVTIACLFYFVGTARRFAPGANARLSNAYIWLALLGVVLIAFGVVQGAPRFMGEHAICVAFGGTMAQDTGWMAQARAWLDLAPACDDPQFALLWWLNEAQKFLLALVTPALVLGTISCLALPDPPTREACRMQAKRLNSHLYLAATVLVLGLLFLSALLRWPASGLQGDAAKPYLAHGDAYLLYWGVTYSIFIASYHLPVASYLTDRCMSATPLPAKAGKAAKADEAGETDEGDSGEEGPMSDLFSLLKTAAALFAPAIAGLLGGVLDL